MEKHLLGGFVEKVLSWRAYSHLETFP